MDIRGIIDKNGKLILQSILLIILVLFAIKSLNSYYENDEQRKKEQANEISQNTQKVQINYSTECKSYEKALSSFINYCNTKELEKAYKMLTDECKEIMFPTIEEFEEYYIKNFFDIKRTYKLEKWCSEGDISTYLITLYGNILETGKTDNYIQDYYTLIKNEDGIYRLNINSFIYRENKDLESTVKNITIKIGKVDVYEEYEEATITITNNTSKKICLTGNKYVENIYLKNSKDVAYSSLNSEFDIPELVLEPYSSQTFIVEFNKFYTPSNKAKYLVLSDVIFDYEEYLNSSNKANYSNRTSIKVKY